MTADAVRRGKPAPDAYLVAAQALGVDPTGCVVIEDAPAGVRAGRAAGMTVWAVTTTHTPDELADADRIRAGPRGAAGAARAGLGVRGCRSRSCLRP